MALFITYRCLSNQFVIFYSYGQLLSTGFQPSGTFVRYRVTEITIKITIVQFRDQYDCN
jgi:hypothetical protein